MSYTPSQYMDRYRNMTVRLADGLTVGPIDVHEYRNAKAYWKTHNWAAEWNKHPEKHDDEQVTADDYWAHHKGSKRPDADHDVTAALDKGWPLLAARLKKKSKSRGDTSRVLTVKDPEGKPYYTEEVEDVTKLYACYNGKGSPEAIAQTLRLANVCGLVEGTRDALQRYCDKYIGLDCNGFVGNYLRACGSDFGPSTEPLDFAPAGWRRSKLIDVARRDVLSWTDKSHVAIIDDRDMGVVWVWHDHILTEARVWVCESCGTTTVAGDVHHDGLNCTRYTLTPTKTPQVFLATRGHGWEKAVGWSDQKGYVDKQMHVYVAQVFE
jgi:hypothetical protein